MDTCSVRGDTVSQTNVLSFARINVVYLPELGGGVNCPPDPPSRTPMSTCLLDLFKLMAMKVMHTDLNCVILLLGRGARSILDLYIYWTTAISLLCHDVSTSVAYWGLHGSTTCRLAK